MSGAHQTRLRACDSAPVFSTTPAPGSGPRGITGAGAGEKASAPGTPRGRVRAPKGAASRKRMKRVGRRDALPRPATDFTGPDAKTKRQDTHNARWRQPSARARARPGSGRGNNVRSWSTRHVTPHPQTAGHRRSIWPSAIKAGAANRPMFKREEPLFHHKLLTRHPACIELTCRRQMAAVMAGLLTCGSQLPRTFPDDASSGPCRGCSPLTVAGAVADLALSQCRTAFPFHPARVPRGNHQGLAISSAPHPSSCKMAHRRAGGLFGKPTLPLRLGRPLAVQHCPKPALDQTANALAASASRSTVPGRKTFARPERRAGARGSACQG